MTIDVNAMVVHVENVLQRPSSNQAIANAATTITRYLNDGGAMEINGNPVQSEPLRHYAMVKSLRIPVEAGRSDWPLPADFGSAKIIESDEFQFRQSTVRELSQRQREQREFLHPGEAAYGYDAPLIAFEAGRIEFFTLRPLEAIIYYWENLADAVEFGNWASRNAPDLYENGITSIFSERVQNEEKKNEQWIRFAGAIEKLNRSKSENAGQFAPKRVSFQPIGGRRRW